jgi:hypothetical protein
VLDPGVVGGSVSRPAPPARSMLRHLTPAGTCRLPETDCRQPASEYRRKTSSPQASCSGKTGIVVLVGNLCALTIG